MFDEELHQLLVKHSIKSVVLFGVEVLCVLFSLNVQKNL